MDKNFFIYEKNNGRDFCKLNVVDQSLPRGEVRHHPIQNDVFQIHYYILKSDGRVQASVMGTVTDNLNFDNGIKTQRSGIYRGSDGENKYLKSQTSCLYLLLQQFVTDCHFEIEFKNNTY